MKKLTDEEQILLEVGDEDIYFSSIDGDAVGYFGIDDKGRTFDIFGKATKSTYIEGESTVRIFLQELTNILLILY